MGATGTWQSTNAGRHLSGRVNKNTAPEVRLGSGLHRLGLRYRKHVRLAKGCTPDLLFPRHRLAVFVDGCFWHGCPQHGRKSPFVGPNAALWERKMLHNRQRDQHADQVALELGWRVVRVWECWIRDAPEEAVLDVASLCGQNSRLPADG